MALDRLMVPVLELMVRISRLERLRLTPVRRLSSAWTRTISWDSVMMLVGMAVTEVVRDAWDTIQ